MEEKPIAPFILSLIAGVLILLGAAVRLILGGVFTGMMQVSHMAEMMGWWMGWWSGLTMPLSIAGLAFGAIVIYAAMMLNSKPAQHVQWGILILIFSILSVFGSWAGFGLGLILGIVGGVLAISWSPTPTQPQSTERICIQCGRTIPPDAKFCPYCGKQIQR